MNLFEFSNPAGWWWALLAAPIVLLYVLKLRVRRQPVSTLLFWDRLFDEKRPRAWWQKMRQLLSLLMQLAFLTLLVAALVDPLWSWQRNRQRRIVLVVDNSASMQALENDQRTRLDAAKQSAAALVRSLRSGDRMALVAAGGRPRVVLGMTDHQRTLLSAIKDLPATEGPTELTSAVELADRLLADDGEDDADAEQAKETIVLTDGCFDGIDALGAKPHVELFGVGKPHDNVGVTRYQVRRSLLDAVGYQVLVDVTNFSDEPVSCRVEINLEDELVDVIPLQLEAGATETRILDHTSSRGGRLIAALDVDDALRADNSAVAVLPTRTAFPVVLATDGNLFLKSVLESIPLVDLQIVAQPPAAAPAGGILVLDRKVPAELPQGRVLVVDPQGDCDAWTLGEPIAQPIVATVDSESPLTQHVRLDNVLFPNAREIKFTADFQPLIQDPLEQPLLARIQRPTGDVVVLTCSLEKGDLPLRIAFPVLAKNTVEWFQGNSGELRPAVSTGEIASLDLPATTLAAAETLASDSSDDRARNVSAVDANKSNADSDMSSADAADNRDDVTVVEQAKVRELQNLVLWSPSQQQIPITATNRRVTVGPLLETGVWSVGRADRGVDGKLASGDRSQSPTGTANGEADETLSDAVLDTSIACNLTSPSESDLRPRGELENVDSLPLVTVGGRSLWFYLTLLATGLITIEWQLYQRRIVG